MFKKIILIISFVFSLNSAALANNDQITVYYFHGNTRCYTCNKMEQYTKEAVATSFNDNKNIVFQAVNTDTPENKHFLKDYSLYTKSVVVKDEKGNWKNLDKIWMLVRDEFAFKEYITMGINDFIKDGK